MQNTALHPHQGTTNLIAHRDMSPLAHTSISHRGAGSIAASGTLILMVFLGFIARNAHPTTDHSIASEMVFACAGVVISSWVGGCRSAIRMNGSCGFNGLRVGVAATEASHECWMSFLGDDGFVVAAERHDDCSFCESSSLLKVFRAKCLDLVCSMTSCYESNNILMCL